MRALLRGEKAKLADLTPATDLAVTIRIEHSGSMDISCFGVDASGILSDDRYFVFYNQPASPESAISMTTSADGAQLFSVTLGQLPLAVDRLVFTATIDGDGTMAEVRSGSFAVSAGGAAVAEFSFSGADFKAEKALLVGELYRKDGWRLSAIGQGFNGGLAALLSHFGGEEAGAGSAPPPPASAPPSPVPAPQSGQSSVQLAKTVRLEKSLKGQPPAMVDLVKKAGVVLDKKGMGDHRARVALCLDISASMTTLYKRGSVQKLCERILALAVQFDDDGACDVFTFGTGGYVEGPLDLNNHHGWVDALVKRRRLEGGTNYALAMKAVRSFYFPDAGGGARSTPVAAELPVYVMFVTDGHTTDPKSTRDQVKWSSFEPCFWQFMAIGKSSRNVTPAGGPPPKKRRGLGARLGGDFAFLEELDDMPGRYVDNADFFSIQDPTAIPDAQLFDLMMDEYPAWTGLARQRGLLRP